MKIYTKTEIEQAIDIPYLLHEIEKGFCLDAIQAPISSLHFHPRGDVHVKSGAIREGDIYVVKIASGFYDNPSKGLPSSNGTMLLFSQSTGQLLAILLDEGRLTDLRTGLTGAIAAKYLAPSPVTRIGIIGTGTQAREQLVQLQSVVACREVLVWGRNSLKAEAFAKDDSLQNFNIEVAPSIEELAASCNLIVTTTPSTSPLLFGHHIRPGTHITAIGTDEKGKQELDASVFDRADMIVADSLSQCLQFGDLSYAKVDVNSIIELSQVIRYPFKREDHWITIADFTGVAISDLQIAKAIYKILK